MTICGITPSASSVTPGRLCLITSKDMLEIGNNAFGLGHSKDYASVATTARPRASEWTGNHGSGYGIGLGGSDPIALLDTKR